MSNADPPTPSAAVSAEKGRFDVTTLFKQQSVTLTSPPYSNISLDGLLEMYLADLSPRNDVILHCGGAKTFIVPKDMVVRNSEYFASCLEKPLSQSSETLSTSIELHNVNPGSLGVYLWFDLQVSTRSISCIDRQALPEPNDLPLLVDAYQLAHRFINRNVRQALNGAIKAAIQAAMTVPTGEEKHNVVNNSSWWIGNFLDGYHAMDDNVDEEKELRGDIVETFCRLFLEKDSGANVRLVDEAFRLAVLDHLISANADLQAKNKKLVEANKKVLTDGRLKPIRRVN